MNVRTHAAVACVMVALLLVGAAAVTAQDAPPTVAVNVSPTAMQVTGADALAAGPTRFLFTVSGKGERGFSLVQLKPGMTPEQADQVARKIKAANRAEQQLGRFLGGSVVPSGQEYATTVELQPGSYALIDSTNTPRVRASFVVGETASAARMPDTTSSIVTDDYRFRTPATLSSTGPYRVENRGTRLHHVFAIPMRRNAKTRRVVARLLKGKRSKALIGPPAVVADLVSGGTVNAVEGSLRKGKVLLVCFVQDTPKKPPHAALGMYKAVTVE
jgi:hypothetical protein